jgi:hypothetical protein
MSVTKVIRYTTKSERAEENERLVRAVFAELSQGSGEGLRYAVFRLEDGVSFVHVAVFDGHESQSGIGERCDEGPVAADATLIGSYRFLPE